MTTDPTPAPMSHRAVLEAMSGLMLGMFVAILSSTVVSTSLPKIVSDLGGSQASYTWVVTSTLLALTVSTPVWGKLADLFDRKTLVQAVLSDLVSPRERGRYSGYLGAVFGVGTVAGPLLGGVITDSFGWRWCFYVGVPFAAAAFVLLQRTLHLPRRRAEVHIDYPGIVLVAGGVSSLLIWVSLAGQSYDWLSWQSAALVGLGAGLCAAAI